MVDQEKAICLFGASVGTTVLYGICYGLTGGALCSYKEGIQLKSYFYQISKKTGKNIIFFAPIIFLNRMFELSKEEDKFDMKTRILINLVFLYGWQKILPKNFI